jgi:hypothetical protein
MRIFNAILFNVIGLLISGTVMAAPVQELGDSEELGLNDNQRVKKSTKQARQPGEKISDLGDGVYVRQYKDFGQPTVEVHPEAGPSYYYNENEIQEPTADDGVMDRQTPSWMIKEW